MNTGEKKAESHVVCIVGMHRSGTSMVTRLLHLCGLDLGAEQDLLGPHQGNPLGHFEHIGFKRLDEALLAHFGGSTDNPPDLKPNWQNDPSLDSILEEARLFLGHFKEKAIWGWKEPRTTLLIPFWKRLLPETRFVICVRNPMEVARSIAERDGMPLEKGYYLWNRYMRAALQDTAGCPRLFTFYEDHFGDGPSEIGRIARFCGLRLPEEPSVLHKVVCNELRHHSCSTADLLKSAGVPTRYKLLYVGLRFLSLRGNGCSSASGHEEEVSKDIEAFSRSMPEDDQEHIAENENRLLRMKYEAIELRSQLNKRIDALVEDRDRLQSFADTVRRTVIYRIYRKFIRPLRGIEPK